MLKLKHRLTLGAISLVPCLSMNVQADSWSITQDFTNGNGSPSLEQTGGTSANSVQTINHINLDTNSGTLATGSSQIAKIGDANNLELIQTSGTENSTQAVNRISAHDIEGASQSLTFGNGAIVLTLKQNGAAAIGNGNTQAVNEAIATGVIDELSQTVSASNVDLNLLQKGAEENTQALNLIRADTLSTGADDVTQVVVLDEVYLSQANTTGSLQSVNALISQGVGTGGALKQSFTGEISQMDQDQVTDSTQTINHVSN